MKTAVGVWLPGYYRDHPNTSERCRERLRCLGARFAYTNRKEYMFCWEPMGTRTCRAPTLHALRVYRFLAPSTKRRLFATSRCELLPEGVSRRGAARAVCGRLAAVRCLGKVFRDVASRFGPPWGLHPRKHQHVDVVARRPDRRRCRLEGLGQSRNVAFS